MQIVVATEKLKNALSKVVGLVEKKSTVQSVYYHNATQGVVLMNATGNNLIITAADLELAVELIIDCNVEKEGKFCINPKNLFFLIKEIPHEEVSLTLGDDNLVKVRCPNINYSLLVMRGDNFNVPKSIGTETPFDISADLFLKVITKTIGSMRHDETKISMNGIAFQQVNGKLRAVSTDGYYLSLIEVEMVNEAFKNLIEGITVPRRGVYELRKLAESFPGGTLSITVDDAYLRVNAENRYFVTILLVAKEFPTYQMVIPKKTEYSLAIERITFLNAIRRIRLMCSNKANRLKLNIESPYLTISAKHPSVGVAEEKIEIEYNGKPIPFICNIHHFLDVLVTTESETLILEFNNEATPMVVKSPTDKSCFSIICPVSSI